LDEWLFFDEREQDGLTFRFGRQGTDPTLYRWEPLTLPPRGRQVGEFCRTLAQRRQVLAACQSQGLLRIMGPFNYEKRWWVGWPEQGGRSPFTTPTTPEELTAQIRDLLPLIRAYEIIHLAGLQLGTPDWGRITRSNNGYQMPDPWIREYLASADNNAIPSGLKTIYPPELNQDSLFSQAADRFYLGVLLYCLICGKIPYRLKNHWPLGIPTGQLIPLTLRQPQLHPELAGIITDLMAVEPEERPLLREVRLQWQNRLNQNTHLASQRDYTANLQKYHRYSLRLRLNNWFSRLKIPLGVCIAFWISITGYTWWQNRPKRTADESVKELFQAPWAAVPLIDPAGCADLVTRLTAEKDRRSDLIKQLTTQPYVKIKALKCLKRSAQRTEFILTLEWWSWERGQWRKIINREKMVLGKERRTWKIRQTKRIKENAKHEI
jgi:hypothetical protein